MSEFFRFPHTSHIAWLAPGSPRDDKVIRPDEAAILLSGEVVVEEKLDGANLGFSVGKDGSLCVQNRGQFLSQPFTGQFERLNGWMNMHRERLFHVLTESLIVFGEWCAARHSLDYDRLPDWWMMFDVYDREVKHFWSTTRRNELAAAIGANVVPCLYKGSVNLTQLQGFALDAVSSFRKGNVEGVIVRKEDALWLQERAKLVRPDFTQSITKHWRNRVLEWNHVADGTTQCLGRDGS